MEQHRLSDHFLTFLFKEIFYFRPGHLKFVWRAAMLKSRGDDKLLEKGCRRTQLGTNVNLEVDLLPVQ